MTVVVASLGAMHFPAQANPATQEGEPISGGAVGAIIGGFGLNPQPQALAGCVGLLTINGINIASGGERRTDSQLDLTMWGLKEIVNAVNGGVAGVAASISPQGRLRLQSAPGFQITIAGAANVLAALGLTAGAYIQ